MTTDCRKGFCGSEIEASCCGEAKDTAPMTSLQRNCGEANGIFDTKTELSWARDIRTTRRGNEDCADVAKAEASKGDGAGHGTKATSRLGINGEECGVSAGAVEPSSGDASLLAFPF